MKKLVLAVLALFVLVTAFIEISEHNTKGSQKADRDHKTYIHFVHTDDWLEMDIFSSMVRHSPKEYQFVTPSKPIYSWYEEPFYLWQEIWQKSIGKFWGIFLVSACSCMLMLLYFRNKNFVKTKSREEIELASVVIGYLLMVGLLVFAYIVSDATTKSFYMTETGAMVKKIYPIYLGLSAQYIIWGWCGLLASLAVFVVISGEREETASAYVGTNLFWIACLFFFWI